MWIHFYKLRRTTNIIEIFIINKLS